MRLVVIGCGYVGTVVAASMARVGHTVVGIEVDPEKLAYLRTGRAPFHEPRLSALLKDGLARGSLTFDDDPTTAVPDADLIFLCLASPNGGEGRASMTQVEAAVASIEPVLRPGQVLVSKSTMPLGANETIASRLRDRCGFEVPVVANPEFLREGTAVQDFLHPDRVVFGADDVQALDVVIRAYRPIIDQSFEFGADGSDLARAPQVVTTDRRSAEVMKFAANAFLASRISLINEIARICDAHGADVDIVARGVGLDGRIGPAYLQAGLGWGGSCFDKDLAILARQARDAGIEPDLIESVRHANQAHRRWVADRIGELLGGLAGRRVALLGLAFKPDTDDVRDSPAVELAQRLLAAGAEVCAHDPVVAKVAAVPDLEICPHPMLAAERADAVVLATEWAEYATLDMHALAGVMRGTLVVDARNSWDPRRVVDAGLDYHGIGRPGIAATAGGS